MPDKLYKILLILGIVFIMLAVPAFWLFFPKIESIFNSEKGNESNQSGFLEAIFLAVGQGDAILIKTPHNQNILIDGGPDSSIAARLSENLAWYDRKIDLMILTHPHDDHVNGLNEVLKRYEVKKVLSTGVVHSSPSYIAWLERIKKQKIPYTLIDRPQNIFLSEDCWLEILYPLSGYFGQEVKNLNNTSIVIKLVHQKNTFLFMGDAEAETEAELLALENSAAKLSADVLKVGHHGSNTSTSQEFLNAVSPKYAVITVGADNSFGHPSRRVIKRLERAGVEILRTDLDVTIKILSDGEEIKIK